MDLSYLLLRSSCVNLRKKMNAEQSKSFTFACFDDSIQILDININIRTNQTMYHVIEKNIYSFVFFHVINHFKKTTVMHFKSSIYQRMKY